MKALNVSGDGAETGMEIAKGKFYRENRTGFTNNMDSGRRWGGQREKVVLKRTLNLQVKGNCGLCLCKQRSKLREHWEKTVLTLQTITTVILNNLKCNFFSFMQELHPI